MAEIPIPEKQEIAQWRRDLEAWGMRIIKHYGGWISGLVLSTAGFAVNLRETGDYVWTWWGLFFAGFMYSSFEAWRDERRDRESAIGYIESIHKETSEKRRELLLLIHTISRRTQEIVYAVLNNYKSDAELYDALTAAALEHRGFAIRAVPRLEPTLITRCLDVDEMMTWRGFLQLGRECQGLNSLIDSYTSTPLLKIASDLLRTANRIYEFTDQSLPREINERITQP